MREPLHNKTASELDAALRAAFFDADAPDPAELDDILDALDEAAPQAPGRDPEAAWAEFLAGYADDAEPEEAAPIPMAEVRRRAGRRRPLLRLAQAAAVLVLAVLGATATARAFGYDLWGWTARWTDREFRFERVGEESDGAPVSIPAALEALGVTEPLYPAWLPDGFRPLVFQTDVSDTAVLHEAYAAGERFLLITAARGESFAAVYEKDAGPVTKYEAGGVVHYLFSGDGYSAAVWHTAEFEVSFIGNVSRAELCRMIDSVYAP